MSQEQPKSVRYAEIGDLARVREFVESGWDVNDYWVGGSTPLVWAAYLGRVDVCDFLLQAGADPSKPERPYNVPPLCKVFAGRSSRFSVSGRWDPVEETEPICKSLLANGAHVDGLKGGDDILSSAASPLFLAVSCGDRDGMALLTRLGANLNLVIDTSDTEEGCTDDRHTVLEWALNQNDQEIAIELLRLGADDACLGVQSGKYTAFHDCVRGNFAQMVEYYVKERGEDLAQRTGFGETLLEIAGGEEVRQMLLSLKAELAVHDALVVETGGDPTVAGLQRSGGMVPL